MANSATVNSPICTKPICKKDASKDKERINTEGTLPVNKPMLRKEIMDFYGIESYKTLKKMLLPIAKKIDDKNRRLFFSPQLRIIREFLDGVPVEY